MPNEITDESTLKLLADLTTKPQSFDRDELIRAAMRNRFHDFKSESATPCIDLVRRLTRLGPDYADMAQKAKEGAYDATKAESEAWEKTDEARQLFAELANARSDKR